MFGSDHILEHGITGGVAGLIATAPMTAAMEAMKRMLPWWQQSPLPPYQITRRVEKALGIKRQVSPEQHRALTLVNHFSYGAAAGAPYGLLAERLPVSPVASGLVYGLFVWAVSYLGWLPAARVLESATRHPAERNALMIVAHLVWGGAMGTLYAAAVRREERGEYQVQR